MDTHPSPVCCTSGFRVVCLISLLIISTPGMADDWSFELTPYLFGTNINGDASVGRVQGLEVDLNLTDILERLDAAGMIHAEARHDSGWGVILDYSFMDVSDDLSGPRGGIVSARVRQGVFNVYLSKKIPRGNSTMEFALGARWWENRIQAEVQSRFFPGTPSANVKEEWIDYVAAFRWHQPLSDDWRYLFNADVGFTEADFTSLVEIAFYYDLWEKWDLGLKYKALWVDFEEGAVGEPGYFKYDSVTHGPQLELVFKF